MEKSEYWQFVIDTINNEVNKTTETEFVIWEALNSNQEYESLLRRVWAYMDLMQMDLNVTALADFFAAKNADYGDAPIERFGRYGIHVRIFDKIARIKNLDANGKAAVTDESMSDSMRDIVGYCIQAIRAGKVDVGSY